MDATLAQRLQFNFQLQNQQKQNLKFYAQSMDFEFNVRRENELMYGEFRFQSLYPYEQDEPMEF